MNNNFEILKKVDWDILHSYIANDLITTNKHPNYDIWVLLYTPKVKLTNSWDLYTKSARGLVIDIDGNILARPFQKFMEIDIIDTEIDMSESFEIFEKYDGSLGIVFWYESISDWVVTTKGGFGSRQAKEIRKMINNNSYCLDNRNTYLFEFLAPENQIIIDYGDKKDLILLAIIATKTGFEYTHKFLIDKYEEYFTIAKKYDIKGIENLKDLKKLEVENKEGYVVKFQYGFRVKVKFAGYDILHRILKHISKKSIWQCLKDGYDISDLLVEIPNDLLDNAPDGFFTWLNQIENRFRNEFIKIENDALKIFIDIIFNRVIDRKEFAAEALRYENNNILFKMYDRRSYDTIIWEIIEPENNY